MVDFHDIDHPVTGIEQDHFKVFLFKQAHLILDERGGIGRVMDDRPLRLGLLEAFLASVRAAFRRTEVCWPMPLMSAISLT